MKKAINILLILTGIIPVVLLFWPFAEWNGTIALILRVIPALAVQALMCRVSRLNFVKLIPAFLTGVFAVWGTYLYFNSQHWSNATVGGLIADYVSPFISCIAVLIFFSLIKRKQALNKLELCAEEMLCLMFGSMK